MEELKAPWLKNYGDVSFHLEYPKLSMSRVVLNTATTYPDQIALSFMGKKTTYRTLAEMIDLCARAFKAIGIAEGQHVCLCMPNVPQTVYCLYALNQIGAIATMIHPLSAEGEIAYYLKEASSSVIVTLNQFYNKIATVANSVKLDKIVITSVADSLGLVKSVGFRLTQGRKIPSIPEDERVVLWKDFLNLGKSYEGEYLVEKYENDPAVILFSGGTTGVTKGILLSNLNFNALALQTITMCNRPVTGKRMLAAMPMFHGFGLGVCVHTMMVAGGTSILIPRFTPKEYAELIVERLRAMATHNKFGKIREMQLDCDWTTSTQQSYFKLCEASRDLLKADSIALSSTIRLHQLSQTAPPVDRGVLMLYNTGNLKSIDTQNSILDIRDVEPYLKKKIEYPIPLDYVYPTFGWGVKFYEYGDFKFIVSNPETETIEEGETMRIERPAVEEILAVKKLVENKLGKPSRGNIIYHLDKEQLKHYSEDEINKIFSDN